MRGIFEPYATADDTYQQFRISYLTTRSLKPGTHNRKHVTEWMQTLTLVEYKKRLHAHVHRVATDHTRTLRTILLTLATIKASRQVPNPSIAG